MEESFIVCAKGRLYYYHAPAEENLSFFESPRPRLASFAKMAKDIFYQLRPLGQKGKIMKKFMRTFDPSSGEPSLTSRLTSGALAVFVAFILAACGGGSGSQTASSPIVTPPPDPGASSPTNPQPPDPGASSPTDPQPPTGKLSIEPSPDCTITEEGVGTCPRTLVASDLKNVSGAVAIIGPKGESLPAKNGVSVPVQAPLGDSTYKLMDGDALLASATVSVTCDAKLEQQGEVCVKPVVKPLHYDVIVVVMRDIKPRNLVARVQGESCATATFEPAVNKTSYPENPEWNFSLFNGEIADKLADGYIPVRLQVVADENKGHVFLYNPITNAVTDDDGAHGALPPAYPNTNPPWHDISHYEVESRYFGANASTDKILIYVNDDTNSRVIFCEDLIVGKRSGKPVKIYDLGDDGLVIGLWHYTN